MASVRRSPLYNRGQAGEQGADFRTWSLLISFKPLALSSSLIAVGWDVARPGYATVERGIKFRIKRGESSDPGL
jgi:hypothetical protein